MSEDNKPKSPPPLDDVVDADRRAALVKIGTVAGITAPAVVTLLTADAASAWNGSGPTRPGRPGRPGRPRLPRIFDILRNLF